MKRKDPNEQSKQTAAIQEILFLSDRQIKDGKVQPGAEVINRLRERRWAP